MFDFLFISFDDQICMWIVEMMMLMLMAQTLRINERRMMKE